MIRPSRSPEQDRTKYYLLIGILILVVVSVVASIVGDDGKGPERYQAPQGCQVHPGDRQMSPQHQASVPALPRITCESLGDAGFAVTVDDEIIFSSFTEAAHRDSTPQFVYGSEASGWIAKRPVASGNRLVIPHPEGYSLFNLGRLEGANVHWLEVELYEVLGNCRVYRESNGAIALIYHGHP